ncbi:hypothetical protein PybrP1_007118 [[Pythium] brassicae (nom. inval.)]|nr:hypothetical protein PybrP1_007118 [[Pythium] brassicae (nom. inval.)]
MGPEEASNAAPPPGAAASSVQLLDGASLEDVLLRQRWAVHWMSRLFHFRRPELSAYAHELVKFLREEAVAAFRREFGYRVSIRHTRAFVVVDVAEEREARDADLAAPARSRARTHEPPARPPRGGGARKTAHSVGHDLRGNAAEAAGHSSTSFVKAVAAAAREDGRRVDAPSATVLARRSSFVLYFSAQEEDEQQQRRSMLQRRTKERQYVVLLRGDVGLLGWACAWLQQRFQCIVSDRQMRISPLNLKWLARNWAAEALANKDAAVAGSEEPASPKPPLLLNYQSRDATSMVRQYTLTVPWAMLRRLWEQSKDAASDASEPPELIQMTETLYFETLPLNLSAFELTSIEMADASVDQNGHLENVPGPASPVVTL